MDEISLDLPTERPRDRAAEVSEWILGAVYDRTESPVYVHKLGALTVAFEAYYIDAHGEPYIDIQLTSMDQPCQPDVVRQGLVEVLDTHPSRRAYWHGMRTKKVYGWRVDETPAEAVHELIMRLLDDALELSGKEIRKQLKDQRPMPWE